MRVLSPNQMGLLLTLLGRQQAEALLERDAVAIVCIRQRFLSFTWSSQQPLLRKCFCSIGVERSRRAGLDVPRVLVVGGEAGGVGALGDLVADDLLQRVDALALGVESVHEMHAAGGQESVNCMGQIVWDAMLT